MPNLTVRIVANITVSATVIKSGAKNRKHITDGKIKSTPRTSETQPESGTAPNRVLVYSGKESEPLTILPPFLLHPTSSDADQNPESLTDTAIFDLMQQEPNRVQGTLCLSKRWNNLNIKSDDQISDAMKNKELATIAKTYRERCERVQGWVRKIKSGEYGAWAERSQAALAVNSARVRLLEPDGALWKALNSQGFRKCARSDNLSNAYLMAGNVVPLENSCSGWWVDITGPHLKHVSDAVPGQIESEKLNTTNTTGNTATPTISTGRLLSTLLVDLTPENCGYLVPRLQLLNDEEIDASYEAIINSTIYPGMLSRTPDNTPKYSSLFGLKLDPELEKTKGRGENASTLWCDATREVLDGSRKMKDLQLKLVAQMYRRYYHQQLGSLEENLASYAPLTGVAEILGLLYSPKGGLISSDDLKFGKISDCRSRMAFVRMARENSDSSCTGRLPEVMVKLEDLAFANALHALMRTPDETEKERILIRELGEMCGWWACGNGCLPGSNTDETFFLNDEARLSMIEMCLKYGPCRVDVAMGLVWFSRQHLPDRILECSSLWEVKKVLLEDHLAVRSLSEFWTIFWEHVGQKISELDSLVKRLDYSSFDAYLESITK